MSASLNRAPPRRWPAPRTPPTPSCGCRPPLARVGARGRHAQSSTSGAVLPSPAPSSAQARTRFWNHAVPTWEAFSILNLIDGDYAATRHQGAASGHLHDRRSAPPARSQAVPSACRGKGTTRHPTAWSSRLTTRPRTARALLGQQWDRLAGRGVATYHGTGKPLPADPRRPGYIDSAQQDGAGHLNFLSRGGHAIRAGRSRCSRLYDIRTPPATPTPRRGDDDLWPSQT